MKLDSKRIHTGRVINLDVDTVRFPDGSTGELEIIRHPGAAAVIPFASDPHGDDPTILLIQQYRYATDGTLIEIPGGAVESRRRSAGMCATGVVGRGRCESRAARASYYYMDNARVHRRTDPPVLGRGSHRGQTCPGAGRIHRSAAKAVIGGTGPHPQRRDFRRKNRIGAAFYGWFRSEALVPSVFGSRSHVSLRRPQAGTIFSFRNTMRVVTNYGIMSYSPSMGGTVCAKSS